MPTPAEHRLPQNRYRNLVLISLLALSGRRPAHGLLERAHRVVTGALPRGRRQPRPREYARVRRQVLRRSLFPRGWHPRGATGLRVSPLEGAGGEAVALEGLEGLDARTRAAYALLRVEGMAPGDARALLASVGVRDADGAVERALTVQEDLRFPDPTVVRVNGRGALLDRRGLAVAAGAACLAVLSLSLTAAEPGAETFGSAARTAPVALADAPAEDTWRERFRLDLTAWHPQGTAVGDEHLVRRALAVWTGRATTGDPARAGGAPGTPALTSAGSGPATAVPRAPRLLFAGEVADREVVLLHDGPWVARYTAAGGDEDVEVFAEPDGGVAHWPALRLADTDAGTHYLLPPWVTEAATAPLGEAGARWSDIPHEDGVTGAVAAGGHCGVGPVLRLRAPEVAHGQAYTAIDLGGPGTAHLGYMPPPPAEIRRLGPHEVLDPANGFDLWGLVACAGAPPHEPVSTATAWEFARQELPGGGDGRWVCVRYGTQDGGGLARAVLVATTGEGTDTVVAGERRSGWDCSNLNRQVVAGTWWQDGDGRWHYLAAASREASRVVVRGGAEGTGENGEPVAVEGPRSGGPPSAEVELSALDARGDEMTVLTG